MSESKFKLLWSEVEKSVAELEQSPSNTLNCTGNSVLTVSETDRLQLSSPGFPTGYDTNLNCVWSFLVRVLFSLFRELKYVILN